MCSFLQSHDSNGVHPENIVNDTHDGEHHKSTVITGLSVVQAAGMVKNPWNENRSRRLACGVQRNSELSSDPNHDT